MKAWGLIAVAALFLTGSAAGDVTMASPLLGVTSVAGGVLVGSDSPSRLPRQLGGSSALETQLRLVAAAARQSPNAGSARARGLGLPHEGDRIRVVVSGATPADASAAVVAAGGVIEANEGSQVQALVAGSSLAQVAAAPGVTRVAPPARAVEMAVGGEEVGTTSAAAWQAAGITGQGVKVAVIDLGFAGLAAAQASGDLPATLATSDDCGGNFSTATPHGTAVAEIVHEIAPNAQLLLACVDSEVTLATAEQWAVAQGATVINHSVGWFNTARGDGSGGSGTPDAVVADAAAHGVLWVNAAGNSGQQHWSGVFSDTNADGFEDFAPGDEGQSVFVPAGSQFCASMRWDEWSGIAADDYDLGVVQAGTGTLVASSVNDQAAGAPPTEEACYTAPADGVYYVAIQRFSGTGSPRIDLFTNGGGPDQYQTASGSITDPAASPSALAVGAVCWQNGALEPYSSQGPTIDGRNKPDLTADDRMSSFTYGGFDSCSGVSGFAGTSAASPTVVGLAALIKQLYPSDTATQIRAYLTSHALDAGPAGPDPQYGNGRALLQPSLSLPQAAVSPSTGGTPTPGHILTGLQGTWTGDGELSFGYQWQRCDAAGTNCGSPASGVSYSVTSADLGSKLRFQVTASSAVGSVVSSVLTRQIGTTAPPINTTQPSIQGAMTVGQTLTALVGVWDSPALPTFVYKWESCLSGTCTTVGTASTYTLATSDLGRQIQLTVIATNPDGQALAVTPLSAAVQAAPPSDGGGGGGGGGSSVPNLGVTIVPKVTSIGPGDGDELVVYVKNSGGAGSLQTHLAIQLPPALTLLGAPFFERGSGCTGTSAIDCFLDYIPNGETTRVILEVRAAATAAGAAPVTATASADRDSDPADNTASITLQVGTAVTTPPPPPPPSRTPSSGKTINGTSHADRLTGTPFADVINGGRGNDIIHGGKGNDILIGGPGLDQLLGGAGNDVIRARDGQRDTIDCGAGHDTVYVDRLDRVAKNCEQIHRR